MFYSRGMGDVLNEKLARRRNGLPVLLILAIAAVFGVAALFASRPVREFIRDPFFEETETKNYRMRGEATIEFQRGWLPELPGSAYELHVKHQTDYGTAVVQFNFHPLEYPSGFPAMTRVDAARARELGPRWIVRRTEWIPAEIRTGRTDVLLSQGFELHRLDQQVGRKTWYLLIHPQNGMAYGWSSNAG